MEITRRHFNRLIASVALLCAAGMPAIAPGATAGAPLRFLKALKPQSFPGRLRPLDEAEVRKPGQWSG